MILRGRFRRRVAIPPAPWIAALERAAGETVVLTVIGVLVVLAAIAAVVWTLAR